MTKAIAIATTIAALMTTTSASAQVSVSEVQDFSSLIRMVGSAGTPNIGLRTIVPILTYTAGTNGIPTRVTMRFSLTDPTSGSTTALFNTTARAFNLPVPCTNPSSWDYDYPIKFFGRWNGPRQTMVVGYAVTCVESGTGQQKEARATLVYSAVVTQAGAATWGRSYTQALIGANPLDLASGNGTLGTQDGVGETLMLTLEGGNGVRVVLLNFETGALFSNPGWTTPSDRNFNTGNF